VRFAVKLILFDIDGTIMLTHNAGRHAMEDALGEVLNRPMPTSGVSFSGKTDPQILMEILSAHDLTDHITDGRFEAILEVYQSFLGRTLPHKSNLLPGVADLVSSLHARPDVKLGLLTGNLQPMAYAKLRAVGLDQYFAFGAFGSDHHERNSLPSFALQRAEAQTGHAFIGEEVIVIGDTPNDIACANIVGASSVAVCTGRFSRKDLAPYSPDLLLDDLTDPTLLLDMI